MNLDEILIKSIVTPTLPDTEYQKLRSGTGTTKSQIRAFVLAEMSRALNESQSLPEFVDKLTAKVKSW